MTEPWRVHTIVFDLDDTLYPEREFVLSGFGAVEEWAIREQGWKGFYRCAERHFEAGVRGTVFNAVLAEMGIEASGPLLAKLVDVYRAHDPRLTLFPDAVDVLDWAAGSFRLALVTDGFSGVQARKIQALGLRKWISTPVISDELGRDAWKPSPRPFQRVMKLCPGEAGGYVYVADNPRKDFIAPRALGWRTIRVRRPQGEHAAYNATKEEEAERIIESLLDLRMILAANA